jgi:hypothetical protein
MPSLSMDSLPVKMSHGWPSERMAAARARAVKMLSWGRSVSIRMLRSAPMAMAARRVFSAAGLPRHTAMTSTIRHGCLDPGRFGKACSS